MVNDKFILVSLDDEKAKSLADVLGNKTCKKIIEHLAEHDSASEQDISKFLKMPLNTVEYNLKKLIIAGFVEKKKTFFWSKKGKKILTYGLTNKSIVISPRNSKAEKVKSLLPSIILLFSGTVLLWVYEKIKYAQNIVQYGGEDAVRSSLTASPESAGKFMVDSASNAGNIINVSPNLWLWFLIGGLLVLFIFAIVNWRKL